MRKVWIFCLLLVPVAFPNLNFIKDKSYGKFDKEKFSGAISKLIFESESWPTELEVEGRKYNVFYNFDVALESYIRNRLKRYRSDYTSIVVINNNNGKVLSAVDYIEETKSFDKSLAFSSTSPAASIFKVVTAADLIEKTEVNKDTEFVYNGKSTTLYKYQLKDKINKWTRTIKLSKAFALSNNVVFGKAAINKLSDESIYDMANKFGFHQKLLQFVDISDSTLLEVETNFSLAELASGFNRRTLISPLHGAVIASIVANEGMLRKPSLVSSIVDVEQKRMVWSPEFILQRSISKSTADELKEMMKLTVERGTARSAFRLYRNKDLQKLEIGGKTGSITGGIPYGKRDWFIAYAKPKDNEEDKGISICVMVVNVKKWHVKSTYLAKEIIQYYYGSLN